MASFLIARLPDESKSLEVIDFMTNNHISYRLSSNSVLLNALMSSGAEDSRLAAAVGFWDGFESVKEEIHVADQFTNIFESVEVKVEDTGEEDADQRTEERPEIVESVENRLEVNEQLNEPMEAVEDEAVAEEEHYEEREEPHVPLIDQVENIVFGPPDYVSSAADDNFPLGNDFSDMVDEEMEEEETDEEHEEEENDGNESEEKNEESENDAAGDDEEDDDTNLEKKDVQKRSKSVTSPRCLFVCPVKKCSYSYTTVKQLKEHVKTHSNKRNFFCDVCKKDFSSKNAAMAHIQGRTRRKCCACKMAFNNSQNLLLHLRVHTGDLPYGCGYCKRRFTLLINLKYHEMMHTGEKPFKCSYCDRRFAVNRSVTDHERTHTGERPYSCKKCNRSYFSVRALSTHNKRKHKREKKT